MKIYYEITPANTGIKPALCSNPVLVAVDLQSGSDMLIVEACDFARSFDAPLAIVHIIHDPASSPGFYKNSAFAERPLEPTETIAARMVKSVINKLKKDYPDLESLLDVSIYLIPGLPKTRIGEVAEKLNAQLLVIGRQKCNGLRRFIDNSITGYLVKKTNVTVAVVQTVPLH